MMVRDGFRGDAIRPGSEGGSFFFRRERARSPSETGAGSDCGHAGLVSKSANPAARNRRRVLPCRLKRRSVPRNFPWPIVPDSVIRIGSLLPGSDDGRRDVAIRKAQETTWKL